MENNIAAIRKSKGVSQKNLAKAVGISSNWLNKIERGKGKPGTGLLQIIAKELDVSLKDIFLD